LLTKRAGEDRRGYGRQGRNSADARAAHQPLHRARTDFLFGDPPADQRAAGSNQDMMTAHLSMLQMFVVVKR
jgi:hypothetical protein